MRSLSTVAVLFALSLALWLIRVLSGGAAWYLRDEDAGNR